jgi:citrate lyase subunit beta / citryl-CoA lyase
MTVAPLTWLYAPASRPALVEKALASEAHAVIVDLEDAVAPEEKEAARANLPALLGGPLSRAVILRINGLATPWWRDDLTAAASLEGLHGLLVPKVESARDVADVVELLAQAGSELPLRCLLESARGIEAALEIASSSTRVRGVSLGEADLRSELRCDESGLTYVRSRVILAAAAAGLPRPPQSVYPRLRDPEGLARSCAQGRELGFLGRAAIHPEQLGEIERAYLPTARELEAAREIVGGAAGARTQADGAFVDVAFLRGAEETVALAERYGVRE